MHDPPSASDHRSARPPRVAIGFLGFGAIAAFFLLSEHRAHALGVLPYLLLLACPLMHLFMHRDHGGQRHHERSAAGGQAPGDRPATSAGARADPHKNGGTR